MKINLRRGLGNITCFSEGERSAAIDIADWLHYFLQPHLNADLNVACGRKTAKARGINPLIGLMYKAMS